MDCVDELSRGGVTCKYLTKKKKNNSKHGKQTKATSSVKSFWIALWNNAKSWYGLENSLANEIKFLCPKSIENDYRI